MYTKSRGCSNQINVNGIYCSFRWFGNELQAYVEGAWTAVIDSGKRYQDEKIFKVS